MFDISAKLVGEQEEIFNVDKIHWEKHSWKHLSLIGDETVINLQRAKVYVFSDSVLCLGRVHPHPMSNEAWKERIGWIITNKSYRDDDGISGEPTEFEWNIFPGFTTLQLCGKVTDLLSRLGETPETFTGRILFMSMFNDISCDNKDNEEACLANAKVVSIDNGHLLVQVPRRNGIVWKKTVLKEFGITSRKRCCWNSQKADVQFSVQQLHCPEVSSKAKDTANCLYIVLRIKKHLRLFFAWLFLPISSVFTEQSQTYVKNMNPFTIDQGNLMYLLMGQSTVLSEIKAEVPLENDDPAYQILLLQRYEERIEKLSQENRVSKFCMDAGFKCFVEIGQYFMTKDNGEQFYAKACREDTFPREDGSSQPKGWIQGDTKIGPVLEVTTSCLYGKHGVEIRIWSLSEDNTQSWVRISHGSNKFVIDSTNSNTEVLDDPPGEQASQLKMKDFACRSKAKAKPQRREPVDSPSIIPMNERKWIDTEPGNSSLCVRDFEESNPSSSTLSNSTTSTRRSSSILENQELSSESISTYNLLV